MMSTETQLVLYWRQAKNITQIYFQVDQSHKKQNDNLIGIIIELGTMDAPNLQYSN